MENQAPNIIMKFMVHRIHASLLDTHESHVNHMGFSIYYHNHILCRRVNNYDVTECENKYKRKFEQELGGDLLRQRSYQLQTESDDESTSEASKHVTEVFEQQQQEPPY